ncbi:D-ribose pyranase [Lactobacillus jensenii]|uniref:D-ribose pyranase n=1 Tax=Lactobacillus jensenii TaxID=109790 RepID=UPI001247B050|nr:D-ribose pyranase [Lactobacillus jensenii]KAA9265162.1 D-ribose pyranase [Lactobacillus jensenii]
MKKIGVMNSDISRVIANMGHMDWLSIGDAGMPVPKDTEKIDLCVQSELPSFIDVLKNVLIELKVQKIYLAEEIKEQNPKQLENIRSVLPDVEIEFVPHKDLKKMLGNTHAFIRTGETTPYSDIILESGVTF